MLTLYSLNSTSKQLLHLAALGHSPFQHLVKHNVLVIIYFRLFNQSSCCAAHTLRLIVQYGSGFPVTVIYFETPKSSLLHSIKSVSCVCPCRVCRVRYGTGSTLHVLMCFSPSRRGFRAVKRDDLKSRSTSPPAVVRLEGLCRLPQFIRTLQRQLLIRTAGFP